MLKIIFQTGIDIVFNERIIEIVAVTFTGNWIEWLPNRSDLHPCDFLLSGDSKGRRYS